MTDELITEFNYELKTPFKYAKSGEQLEAMFITLKAPTSKNIKENSFLKQAFFRSLPKQNISQDNEQNQIEDNIEITGSEIIAMITMSDNVELITILLTAKELFSSGIALVDGEEKLTKPLIDKITQDDLEDMVGSYMANFTLASSIAQMKNQ